VRKSISGSLGILVCLKGSRIGDLFTGYDANYFKPWRFKGVLKFSIFIIKRRWWVLAFWLIAAVLIVSLSPSLSSVESNDQNSFIPKKYESIKALTVAQQISPHSQNASDFIAFKNKSGRALSKADMKTISRTASALADKHLPHVASVTTGPQQLAPNRKVMLATVTYSGNPDDTSTINAVKGVRDSLHQLIKGSGLVANDTGQEAIGFDTQDASNRALKIVSMGTLLLVLVLPALVFRSPFAGLLPILAVGIVDVIASSLIADAAKLFDFKVNQQLSVIFTVVLFGIGTDYILFLLFRYRERLRDGDHTRGAVAFALKHAGIAILSAALVVLTSFAALFFASFGIFSSMAPGLVICVGVMMLAALTLVPALVGIVGQRVFWPSKAWKSKSLKPTISKKIGGFIARRPVVAASVVIVLLIGLSACALGFKSDFSSFSKPPAGTESARGYSDLLAAFPAGETDPAQVYVKSSSQLTQAKLEPLERKLRQTQGVATVLPATIAPSGNAAMVSAILKDNPYSNTAVANISGPIRDAAHSFNSANKQVYVGGTTSIFADIQAVSDRDLRVLFPIAAAFIFLILGILLRSLVAPIFLLFGVGLGYMATLGATTLIFIQFKGDPGLIFFIPLFMYIFVVAIGTDYNILTITRLREEIHAGHGPHKAADLTVEHSSATVASAGLILAATFGSLLLADISFLSQMGAAIAIGVILAAFVIAPFLIPSISAILGYKIWWPGHRPTKD
jgi:putative drug exporter of the RND superfamily